jgi:hypothetical protein
MQLRTREGLKREVLSEVMPTSDKGRPKKGGGITPSIVKVSPTSGPPGTPFQIEIKGVGWTEYDNTYQIT